MVNNVSVVLFDDRDQLFDHSSLGFDHAEVPFDDSDVLFDDSDVLFDDSDVLFDHVDQVFDHVDQVFDHAEVPFDDSDVLFDDSDVLFDHVDHLFDHIDHLFDHIDHLFDHVDHLFDYSGVAFGPWDTPNRQTQSLTFQMAQLPEDTIATVLELQRRLLEIIHQATLLNFLITEQHGETSLTLIYLEQLDNAQHRADTYYSRLYNLMKRIAESQPTASPAMLNLLTVAIAEGQASVDALDATLAEIKSDWRNAL